MGLTKRSEERLAGVDKRLVDTVKEVAKWLPIQVTEGLRAPERQAALVKAGKSKTLNSKHLEGKAVDLVWIEDGKAIWDAKFYFMVAGAMFEAARLAGVKLRWGGNWKQDLRLNENSFNDFVHFEIHGD